MINFSNFDKYLLDASARPIQNINNYKVFSGIGIDPGMHQPLIHAAFSELKFSNDLNLGNYYFIWGHAKSNKAVQMLDKALQRNKPVLLCEDGFLRSADTWCSRNVDPIFTRGCSLTIDTKAYYFDAIRVSNIESMINDPTLILTQDQIDRAKSLIQMILTNKLTKYNHQPIFTPTYGRSGHKKVLIIDQSYGDYSISYGKANDSTFDKMLKAAIAENPDYDILIKTHPDTIQGGVKCYYGNVKQSGNVFKVTDSINPYSLLDIVDKVYVCTTQFGFEALMAGKEVHTFGVPFYSGWGLTIDDQKLERRTQKRSLEELFYIFYCMYTRWIDPIKEKPCEIEDAMEYLINIREQYWKKYKK